MKYYEIKAKYEGETEILFGSFSKDDCTYELEAERDSWKGEGYKAIKIVSRETTETPDPEVYKNDVLVTNDDAPETDTITVTNHESQAALYKELQGYSFTDELTHADFFKVGEIDGILYYAPNNEDWGSIIAVSHEHQLARDTMFYEMDDMEYPDSDYKHVVVDGVMNCKVVFETE